MARRNTSEPQTEHRNSHLDEEPSYPGEREEAAFWEAVADRNLLQFTNELKQVNERAAHALDHRTDIREFPEADREEIFKDYAQAFGKIDFEGTPFERRYTSEDIAETLFKPMQEDLARESHSQLTQSWTRIPHSKEVLDNHQNIFARALRDGYGEKNPPDTRLMSETFREASDYILDQNLPDLRTIGPNEFSEFTKTSSDHQWTESLKILHSTWHDVQESLNQTYQENRPEFQRAAQTYLNTARESIHKYGLYEALAAKSYEDFTEINEAAQLGKEEFADIIQNNRGFVKAQGYEQCELPEKFETIGEAIEYMEKTREQLEEMRGNEAAMSRLAHRSATSANANLDGWIENIQSEMNTADDPDPEYRKAHLEEAQVHLEGAHQAAQILHFVMRPWETTG